MIQLYATRVEPLNTYVNYAEKVISYIQSYGAPHQNKNSNTLDLQLTLPPLNNTDMESIEFWHGVGEEIQFLASLKETCESDKLP
jgi:hypothetical protein